MRVDAPVDFAVRTHRAISWVKCAQQHGADLDLKFLCLWIAFNAAYARQLDFSDGRTPEKMQVDSFFDKLCQLDEGDRIYNAIWQEFPGPLRTLFRNKFVFKEFWLYKEGKRSKSEWKHKFKADRSNFKRAVRRKQTWRVLTLLFARLYLLRNQLVHGAATHGSGINRQQVRDSAAILAVLVPTFIDIVLENPLEDWGSPSFPVLHEEEPPLA